MRGAQPRNRNARKHGFYAARLAESELAGIWDAVVNDGIAPPVAVLRLKLDAALREAPGNQRVREDAARLLERLYGADLDAGAAAAFRDFVTGLLYLTDAHETNRVQTAGNGDSLTKRIEAENWSLVPAPASKAASGKTPFSRNESCAEGL
jgi:hypothetical protein